MDHAALEARLLRVLRRYLAPELAARAVRDALRPNEPEPPREEEFTELERKQMEAAWLKVGKIRRAR